MSNNIFGSSMHTRCWCQSPFVFYAKYLWGISVRCHSFWPLTFDVTLTLCLRYMYLMWLLCPRCSYSTREMLHTWTAGVVSLMAHVANILFYLFFQVEVREGSLVCPETSRKFPISNGIPNMLLNEDEVWKAAGIYLDIKLWILPFFSHLHIHLHLLVFILWWTEWTISSIKTSLYNQWKVAEIWVIVTRAEAVHRCIHVLIHFAVLIQSQCSSAFTILWSRENKGSPDAHMHARTQGTKMIYFQCHRNGGWG